MASLRERLVERIRRDGPIDFGAYMAAALYDAEDGFYARGPTIGPGGHFTTSAVAHPAFADAIAQEAISTWQALGRPSRFRVCEAGPGSGALARRVAVLLDQVDLPLELVLIERSAGLRERQAEALDGYDVTWVENPDELEPAAGFLFANELLDALPVRLLAWPDEILVGADDAGRLVEVSVPADAEVCEALRYSVPDPRRGGRYAVRPGAVAMVAALARTVERGRLLLVDYGGVADEVHDGRRSPIRTYIGGQPGGNPLAAPGTQDLTADVDFGVLLDAAPGLGLAVERYCTQAAWLTERGWAAPPPEARSDEDWVLAGLVDERLPFQVLALERG
jgi:NADH dehydrogenase [ubiquinone] 1 alpha subcomplex assembly factor 7